MTLHFGEWPWKAYNFACFSVLNANLWQGELRNTLSSKGVYTNSNSTEAWLRRVYAQLKLSYGEKLHVAYVLATFSRKRLYKSFKVSCVPSTGVEGVDRLVLDKWGMLHLCN